MKKFLSLLLFLIPVSAFAHAFPVSYSPDGFSLNSSMPREVMIRFSQGISSIGNGIEVFAPDGTKLPAVDAIVSTQDEHILSRSVAAQGEGVYVVSWHGVSSEDGHFTKGAFSFFVGATSTAPEFYGGTKLSKLNFDMKEVVVIFFVFLSLAIVVASLVLSFLFRREKMWSDHDRGQFITAIRRFVYFALLPLFIGIAAMVIMKVRFPFMKPSGLFAVLSLLANSVSILALVLWVGSILAFAAVCIPLIASQSELLSLRAPLRAILGRISASALLFGGVSGALSVWVHLKSLDNFTTTSWGSTLITFLLLGGIMLLLRCLSLFFLERMKRCVHCEWAYALLESGVGLCVLFCIVLISMTSSPVYNSPLWSVMRMDSSRMITVADLGEGDDVLRMRAYDAKGVPISSSLPLVLLDNAKEGIGPLAIPVKDRGGGRYDIPEALLTPKGEWRIAITFKQQGAYDINTTIGIDYPREILTARTKALTPRFGAFETEIFGIGLALLVLSFAMLIFVKHNNMFALLHPEYDTEQSSIGARKAIAIAFIALLSLTVLAVMLRMLLPFYSEEIPDGRITHMSMEGMPKGMSGMQM